MSVLRTDAIATVFRQVESADELRLFSTIQSAGGFRFVEETRIRHPSAVKVVAPVLYALALTPGLSRMYLGQHWASDIVSGAFVGTFYGWRIVNYSHEHPTTRIDRIFLGTTEHRRVGAGPAGATMSWTTTF